MDKATIKTLIIRGDLPKAMEGILHLSSGLDDNNLHTQAIMQSARLNSLQKQTNMGIISAENANISRNQITRSLLWLVDQLEDTAPQNDAISAPTRTNAVVSGKKLFISYAREDRKFVDHLENHLYPLKKNGLLDTWTDSNIRAGQPWSNEIESQLKAADIIALIVSSDFLSSDYIQNHEIKWAEQLYQSGKAIILPIIVRSCFWNQAFFAEVNAYPRNPVSNQLVPVNNWEDQDAAYLAIIEAIMGVLKR